MTSTCACKRCRYIEGCWVNCDDWEAHERGGGCWDRSGMAFCDTCGDQLLSEGIARSYVRAACFLGKHISNLREAQKTCGVCPDSACDCGFSECEHMVVYLALQATMLTEAEA